MIISLSLIRRCCLGVLVMIILISSVVLAAGINSTSVRFRIVNSYSGTISIVPQLGVWLQDGMQRRWTTQQQISIQITANKSSTYVIHGDFVGSISGSGLNSYHQLYDVDLGSGEIHHLDADFMSDGEPLSASGFTVMLDQNGPTMPLLGVADNSTITGHMPLSRSSSSDSGIGMGQYVVLLGLTPSISSMVAVVTSNTGVMVPRTKMPSGTIYRTVIAVDKLGNQSDYRIGYFHHVLPTSIGGSYTPTSAIAVSGTMDDQDQMRPLPSEFGPDVLPGFFLGEQGELHHYAAQCPGLRIATMMDCVERDRLLMAHQSQSLPTMSQQARDDLPPGLVWVGKVPTINQFTSAPALVKDESFAMQADTLLGELLSVRYELQQPQGRSLPSNTGDDVGAIHHSAGLVERMFDGYMCERINYCRESYSNLICEYINYCGGPNPDVYESIIRQYGENVVSRTQVFSRYAILITISLVMMSIWFFVLGYHHHYVIRYLK